MSPGTTLVLLGAQLVVWQGWAGVCCPLSAGRAGQGRLPWFSLAEVTHLLFPSASLTQMPANLVGAKKPSPPLFNEYLQAAAGP